MRFGGTGNIVKRIVPTINIFKLCVCVFYFFVASLVVRIRIRVDCASYISVISMVISHSRTLVCAQVVINCHSGQSHATILTEKANLNLTIHLQIYIQFVRKESVRSFRDYLNVVNLSNYEEGQQRRQTRRFRHYLDVYYTLERTT